MAQTEARIGYGCLLQIENGGSPLTWKTVAEIKSVGQTGFTADLQEATHMESPNRYKEWVAGMLDGDAPTHRANMTPDSVETMKGYASAGITKRFRIIWPGDDLGGIEFSGAPTGFHYGEMTPSGVMEAFFSFKITGDIEDLD